MGCECCVVYDFVNVVYGEVMFKQVLIKDKWFDNLYVLVVLQICDKDVLIQEGVGKVFKDLVVDGFDYIICDLLVGIEKGVFLVMYYVDCVVVVVNLEVLLVCDFDCIIGLFDLKMYKVEFGQSVLVFLFFMCYSLVWVESGEMLSIIDVEEVLGLKVIGVVFELGDVLNVFNKGELVILDFELVVGQVYEDVVGCIFGEECLMCFIIVEKKGFFSKLFGG